MKGVFNMSRIIMSPGRYIQGSNELTRIKEHIVAYGKSFLIIGTERAIKQTTSTIETSFKESGCKLSYETFNRECCVEEIERLMKVVKASSCDVIVGVGGGKTFDTAKAVAYYCKLPVIIVPTIAATDAPCSALSVIYTKKGVFSNYLLLPKNPEVVLVDTDIVAEAPVRLLYLEWEMHLLHILKQELVGKEIEEICQVKKQHLQLWH